MDPPCTVLHEKINPFCSNCRLPDGCFYDIMLLPSVQSIASQIMILAIIFQEAKMEAHPFLSLRHYQPADFPFLQSWVTNERTHALWSARHMPFPLAADAFEEKLQQGRAQWNDEFFVLTNEQHQPIGFAACSISSENHRAHIKYVIVDPCRRGLGLGTCMIKMLLDCLFESEMVHFATLSVFDSNQSAIRCYQKAGFRITSITPNVFFFQNECWGRISMQKDR